MLSHFKRPNLGSFFSQIRATVRHAAKGKDRGRDKEQLQCTRACARLLKGHSLCEHMQTSFRHAIFA